jgi:hypothetical protein
MITFTEAIQQLREEGAFAGIANNPMAQFGTRTHRYFGHELLPVETKPANAYRETAIEYRTVVASDSTRFSPPKLEGDALIGSFLVELGELDLKREITSQQIEEIKVLLGNDFASAKAKILSIVNTVAVKAFLDKEESQIWQALANGEVVIEINGTTQVIPYLNPTGHRVAGSKWDDDTVNPIVQDLIPMQALLSSKGYDPSQGRLFMGRIDMMKLINNKSVKATFNVPGRSPILPTEQVVSDYLQAAGFPRIELVDGLYRTATGTQRFLPANKVVLVGATGPIDLGDGRMEFLPNTLGYTAIGVAVGQNAPGRVIRLEEFSNKPPRVEIEGWQTSLPVIKTAEAIAVRTLATT